MHPRLKRRLLARSSEPYRATGRFNYHWARNKLWRDPVFAALIDRAVLPDQARVLDLGCGRGLLASWLLGAEYLAERGEWEGARPPAVGLRFQGVELMAREAACGNQALQPLYGDRVRLRGGDVRDAALDGADVIAMLDVLHYIPYPEQDRLLDRIADALGRNGLFVTRVGDAGGGLGFAFSQLVDRIVSFAQGHRLPQLWCRPFDQWQGALRQRGFEVEAIPMSAGTPFANIMLVARATRT